MGTDRGELRPPHLWLGHDIKQGVRVWERIPRCPGIMLNAYHLIQRPWFVRRIRESSLHQALNYSGPVFLDSGGFLFQRADSAWVLPSQVMDLWSDVEPDLGAVLDIPFSPAASNGRNASRWRRTLTNTATMSASRGAIEICPVVHSYSLAAVERRCEQVRRLIPRPRIVCIGSLVPLIQGRYLGGRYASGSRGFESIRRWRFMGQLVQRVREAFPESVVHVFGGGSLSTLYLLHLVGADSLDSTAWRLKAAYGEIQLPGTPNRCVSASRPAGHTRRALGAADIGLLAECACPACIGYDVRERIRRLSCSYELRAIHNAHTFISEMDAMRTARQHGCLEAFVEARLRHTPRFRRVLGEAVLPLVGRCRHATNERLLASRGRCE